MMNAAKVIFVLFLAAMVYVLMFGHVNGDRGFAMCLLIIGCICQILYGPVSSQGKKRKDEVLVFHPLGRKQ